MTVADEALATIPVVFVSAFPHTLDTLQTGPLRGAAILAGRSVPPPPFGSLATYGKVRNVLTTLESTRLEPGAYDEKIYRPGGRDRERAVARRRRDRAACQREQIVSPTEHRRHQVAQRIFGAARSRRARAPPRSGRVRTRSVYVPVGAAA